LRLDWGRGPLCAGFTQLVLRVSASTEEDEESNLANGSLHIGIEINVAGMQSIYKIFFIDRKS